MKNIQTTIPSYVSSWTDKYFHQSAFDVPWSFPKQRVIKFLSRFKKDEKIKLFRGINKFNENGLEISSWTYDREIAKNYIQDGGRIIEREFSANEVVLDTTILNMEQRALMGYDYKFDDKEVLVINNKLKYYGK